MKIRLINKSLGMSGRNILFNKEEFFGLKPDEFIIQIGNGNENGTIRTDKFQYPIRYVGSIICQFDKQEKMFAFLLPEKIDNEDIFLLYGKTTNEIFTERVFSMKDRFTGETTSYLRFYFPFFIRSHN